MSWSDLSSIYLVLSFAVKVWVVSALTKQIEDWATTKSILSKRLSLKLSMHVYDTWMYKYTGSIWPRLLNKHLAVTTQISMFSREHLCTPYPGQPVTSQVQSYNLIANSVGWILNLSKHCWDDETLYIFLILNSSSFPEVKKHMDVQMLVLWQ